MYFQRGVSSSSALGGVAISPFFRPENIVHQMMPTKINPAPKASSRSSVMAQVFRWSVLAWIVGILAACSSAPRYVHTKPVPNKAQEAQPQAASSAVMTNARSQWVRVDWAELPGFNEDALAPAWNAWIKSCERPVSLPAPLLALCPQVRALSIASQEEQQAWLQQQFVPYRVESLQGEARGLLTAYFEPVMDVSRTPSPMFPFPLYQVPANLNQRTPWFSRQEIDTLAQVQAQLQDRVLAYAADPIDVLILQIQGSGRIRVAEPDGSTRMSRLAYAATNDQPYQSVGKWLLDQGLVKDASWPGIKAWVAQNPHRLQELLWVNPRVVFFKEEALGDLDMAWGPKGAQGVALTPGRSIAIDPLAMPYGTPVWLVSRGPQVNLQKLVFAQDTGSAIVGAVRADYFVGAGVAAGELAGRLKQPLNIWVLWPKSVATP
jgi:membrane-bound lytic murein transglycosylase A